MSPAHPLPRPVSDGPAVRALCTDLVPGAVSEILPNEAPSWAEPNECTSNVARQVQLKGGQVDYGWRLWETLPGLMIEAEFHAVWMDDRGVRHDVSPTALPSIREIVFLPDPRLSYNGQQIDNVRVALRDDDLLHDFIAACEALFEVMYRGELARLHGEIPATPEMLGVQARCIDLEAALVARYYG